MWADVELNVVQLNMSSTTSKAMSEQMGAQMQEMDSWNTLDFKLIAEKFVCGAPLHSESSEDDDQEDDELGTLLRVLHLLFLGHPPFQSRRHEGYTSHGDFWDLEICFRPRQREGYEMA